LPGSFQTTAEISRVGHAHPDFFQGGRLPTLLPPCRRPWSVGVFVCGGTKVLSTVVDNVFDGTQLQNDWHVIGDWAVKRQMNFNVEICKFVHYVKRSIEFEYSL